MFNILDFIGGLVLAYPGWSHMFLGIMTLLQGEVAVFFGMYLVVSGSFTWLEYFGSTFFGLVIGESCVFLFGRMMRHTRFGWKLYRNKIKRNKKIQLYTRYLKENLEKLFIIAKFLVGVNFVILFLTGWSKTSFRKFFKAEATATFLWLSAISVVAYSFTAGLHFLKSSKIFEHIEYLLIGVVILVFGGEHFLKKAINKKMEMKHPHHEIEDDENEERLA